MNPIRSLREDLGLSQGDFATRLGLKSKAHVSAIESGKAAPGIRAAFEIERISGGKLKAVDLNPSIALVIEHIGGER